jgi:hypothetical protein
MKKYPANTAQALAMNFDESRRPKSAMLRKALKKQGKKVIELKLSKIKVKDITGKPEFKIAVIGTGDFSVGDFKTTVDDWVEYAKESKISPVIIRYVMKNPNVFTLRSWGHLSDFLKTNGVKHLTYKKLNEIVTCAIILKRTFND